MDEVCSPVTDVAGLRRKGRGAGSSAVRPGPGWRERQVPPLFMIAFPEIRSRLSSVIGSLRGRRFRASGFPAQLSEAEHQPLAVSRVAPVQLGEKMVSDLRWT